MPRRGVVARLDPSAGLGTVVLDDGTEVGFHATQLADGSRRVDVGVPIACRVASRRVGAMEAIDVVVERADVGPSTPAC